MLILKKEKEQRPAIWLGVVEQQTYVTTLGSQELNLHK